MKVDQQVCRPLIALNISSSQKYIPLQYTFTLKQILTLKNYLPKTLKLVGIDFKQKHHDRDIKGIKIVIQKGINKDKTNIKLYNHQQLVMVEWNIPICINLPYDIKSSQQRKKIEMKQYLENVFTNYIHLIKLDGNFLADQIIHPKDIQQTKILIGVPAVNKSSANYLKTIKTILPIKLLLDNSSTYQSQNIIQEIKNDIISSLIVMVNHNLPVRLLEKCVQGKLYLQSYFKLPPKNNQQAFRELSKLYSQPNNQIQGTKDSSNKQLGMLIFGLFVIVITYIALKMYSEQYLAVGSQI